MADCDETDAIPIDATEVRFGLRSMLIVMAVVAVATTALGAFIRHFPPDARLRLGVFWGILGAILITLLVFHAWRRRRAERKAGRVFFQLLRHSYFFPRQPAWAMLFAGGFSLSIAPAIWVAGSYIIARGIPADWWEMLSYGTIYSVLSSGAGITILWWRRIRLCENGFVAHNRFLPWSNCKHWYRDACTKNVIVAEFSGYGRVAAKVPEKARGAVEAFLRSNLPNKYYD